MEDTVGHYAVELVTATRDHSHALVGASPRGTLALITCARALAVIRGRDYVVPEDVKALAHPALDHRVTVKPELWLQNATGAGVVEAALWVGLWGSSSRADLVVLSGGHGDRVQGGLDHAGAGGVLQPQLCLLYTSPSPRDRG